MSNISFEYLYYYSHQKDSSVTMHRHSFYELVYYLNGKGISVASDNQKFTYKKGDFIIYPPDTFHDETHEDDVSVFCVAFKALGPEILTHTKIYHDKNNAVMSLIDKIKAEIKLRKYRYKNMAESYIQQILINADRLSSIYEDPEHDLDFIRQIITENLTLDIDLNTLAKLSGYSYHRFRHIFKEKLGNSPKQYILAKRLDYAQKMLQDKSFSISEVALQCGFASFSAFSRHFKQYVGVSPSEYRQQNTDDKLYKTVKRCN